MVKNKVPSLQSRHTEALVELEHYKLLVESVEDYAIFLLDPNGYILTWNKGAERNKGYKDAEIIGKHFSTFYLQRDKDDKKPERELEIAIKNGRVEDEDWRVRKDGTRFWANVIITALFTDEGKLVGFAKVTRDLTERKEYENNLRKANSLLLKQQDELKLLNETKDEFISLASHQLRTPATAIKQLLGLLLEGFRGDLLSEQEPLIRKAYEANDRQISIVNNLLKVAQLDAGKVVLNKSAVNVATLLQEVIAEQSDTISGRHQIVKLSLGSKPVYVHGDARYLRQAFENLVDNASKYTHEHGKIAVSITEKDSFVLVKITDTGIGIPPESVPELFQKFKRIPNELSQKVSGSGLGLYWVREIVALHGGRIEIESEHLQGTTFFVYLPRTTADA